MIAGVLNPKNWEANREPENHWENETYDSNITREQYESSWYLQRKMSWEEVQKYFKENPNGILYRPADVFSFYKKESKKDIVDPNACNLALVPLTSIKLSIAGLFSAGVDYVFQVGKNFIHGKDGTDALSDVNVGEIGSSYVSGGLSAPLFNKGNKLVGFFQNKIVRKIVQLGTNATISAAASVLGTIEENLINGDSPFENVEKNAIVSGISGGIVSALSKTPPMTVKVPD